ncbi:MAG: phytase, partial [Pseudomonadota bacterium]|nr:phytase [Pseudomonadota bacterium]
QVASQPEGCVADDALGYLYVGEEHVGIWKFQAEPKASTQPLALVDSTDAHGHITADVEGLTLYETSATTGYLIASSQGNHSFTVYRRQEDNAYLGRFRIERNKQLAIDSVEDTDGIAVTPFSLGPAFPYGVFVAQDGRNTNPDENQNFKLVPWMSIAQALRLP